MTECTKKNKQATTENSQVLNLCGSKDIFEPDGEYVIGQGFHELHFAISKTPNFVNRLFCKWCLGWRWIKK